MNIAVVTAAMQSGERGGAEAFYEGLTNALRSAGHTATQVPVRIDESTFDRVVESYTRCYDLDVSSFDLVISTKAPTYVVRHPRHIAYLVHTLRVFYDRFEHEYGHGTARQHEQRRLIHAFDKAALHPSRIIRHHAIGHTCYRRLHAVDDWWQRIQFSVLHLPPALTRFSKPRRGEYVLLAGRLHRWKRTDLVVRAFRHVRHNVPLLIAGTGEDEAQVRRAADGDRRVQFLGSVSTSELLDLYAGAIVVPFVPIQEDFGLITVEAFHSRKPVITCTDSGEPLEFVKNGITGFVVDPDERALAERINRCIEHPADARAMGRRGYEAVSHITWESLVSKLLAAAAQGSTSVVSVPARHGRARPCASKPRVTEVAVLDMQPIHPAVGGGRLRLLGLYHNLGRDVRTTYVGTYDWPGEHHRELRLSETLTEIDVPLSTKHFTEAAALQRRTGGRTIIDTAFPLLAHHSPEYVARARAAAKASDVVVFSHPWVYPLVKDVINRSRQLLVYDSQNVESVLRHSILADTESGRELVRHATCVERELCRRADLVLACSQEDRLLFHELYAMPLDRCVVVPNGTFISTPPDERTRRDKKRELNLESGVVALFVGSLYPPNEEAATAIVRTLAPAMPQVTFVICGGVSAAIDAAALKAAGITNVRLTGAVDDETRRAYLAAADVAINPMSSGSGTNIKMFDFMAAGLPVISTPKGARGIRPVSEDAFRIAELRDFPVAIAQLIDNEAQRKELAAAGLRLVRESYSWERISASLGRLLTRARAKRRRRPLFSIVVPTFERQDHLGALLECLQRQTCRDFEVILVDQSRQPWTVPPSFSTLDIVYVHSDVKGTSRARNTGAFFARGDVLAFTDDDCRPYADWLENAKRYFASEELVGVEGLIVSDKVDDPEFRAVTNVGFEGIGFMTANLFLRRRAFNAVDGFDERFDLPFREDTDLGWRASALGQIPFGRDVRVFHPPHPRTVEREAATSRVRLFEKDALLLKKHPERYKSLFLKEGHFMNTAGFWEHFTRGGKKYGVDIERFVATLETSPRAASRAVMER